MMRRRDLTLAALALLLLAPAASAHGAPPPRGFETRLLGDCNDDWFGGDAGGLFPRQGYDLHSLDVREMWSDVLGDHVRFRIIANGDGPATVTVGLQTSAGAKSVGWQTSGGAWSSSSLQDVTSNGINDGDRFALEGSASFASLGLSIGVRLTDYTVTSTADGEDGDSIPGNDRQGPGACDTADARTEYKRTNGYALTGPVQYAHFPARDAGDCRAGPEHATQQLLLNTEKFIDLVFCNAVRDASPAPEDDQQEFRLSVASEPGLDLRFHDPTTGSYAPTVTKVLDATQGTLIHLAATASQPGASGTIEITLTTNRGGHESVAIPYSVEEAAGTTTTTTSAADDNGTPGPGALLAAMVLCAAAVARRR